MSLYSEDATPEDIRKDNAGWEPSPFDNAMILLKTFLILLVLTPLVLVLLAWLLIDPGLSSILTTIIIVFVIWIAWGEYNYRQKRRLRNALMGVGSTPEQDAKALEAYNNFDKHAAETLFGKDENKLPEVLPEDCAHSPSDLTSDEMRLLQWLAKEDYSLYGECRGPSLDSLRAKGLVKWTLGTVQRARYMTLETIAPLSDDQTIMLPIAAA